MGRRDHDYRYEDNPYSQVTYTSNAYFHQTFHVISSTELIGYQFSIGKREFQIGAGFTFNYFVAGKHYENNIHDKENGEYVETEKSLNPFSINDFELPAKRFNNQITLGLGCELTEKIDISLNVSAGQEIYYLEFRPDYWNSWCATSWGKNYSNMDFSITARYNLNNKNNSHLLL